jgi:hypothetical protein
LFKRNYAATGDKKAYYRGAGGWQKRSFSGTSRKSGGEKLIYVELVGPNTIAIKFDGFFDNDIKEKVKKLPDSKYDSVSKEWFIRKDLMSKLFDEIGQMCIDREIKIADIPGFVDVLARNPIPFSKES